MEVDEETEGREKARNVLSFFCYGLLSVMYHGALVLATLDSQTGSSVNDTTGVLCVYLPQMLFTFLVPWVLQKFPHICKVMSVFILFAVGLLMLVCSDNLMVRLAGIAVAELGRSMAEMSILSLTAFYGEVTTSAFVSGTGIGLAIGPLYYSAMTKWSCVAPRLTMIIAVPAVLLFLVVYAMLDRSPLKDPWTKPASYEGIKYELLSVKDESYDHRVTWSMRTTIAWSVLPLIIFLYWGSFTDYLSRNAVVTTLAFDQAPFSSRHHYQYYAFCDLIGELLGRSYLLIIAYTCPGQVRRAQINKTWILALIIVCLNIFLVTVSWFRFTPHVGFIMFLCITQGFTAGALYLNSAHEVRDQINVKTSQEFGLSLLILGITTGQLAGGLLSTLTYPSLEEHCLYALKLDAFCHTRYIMGNGWDMNERCM